MQLQRILTGTIIAVLLAGALGAWFYFGRGTPDPQDTTPTDVRYPISYPTGVSVDGGVQSGGVETKLVDLAAEFELLFGTLNAKKVAFSDVASSAGEMGSVYTLYAQDIETVKKEYPSVPNPSVKVALLDLNEDGGREALVYVALPGSCGSAGCAFDIYKNEQGAWVSIFSTLTGEFIAQANSYTSGYVDLLITQEGEVVRYAWDGTTYTASGAAAEWDGTTFKVR